MIFSEGYPIDAKTAAFTPMVFHARWGFPPELPFPSLAGIRDFAYFAGISDNALRSALSRAKADGRFFMFKDNGGISRYHVHEKYFQMGRTPSTLSGGDEGFTVAVFSFTTRDVSQRAIVRETLKHHGFKKLAQNTYINGRIQTAGLRNAMMELGLEKNLYLFQCPDIDDSNLIQKILTLFDVEGRKRVLVRFFADMRAFLSESTAGGDELARRLMYVGPVFWEFCQVNEPPFPGKHLPPDYPLRELRGFYRGMLEKNKALLRDYYRRVHV